MHPKRCVKLLLCLRQEMCVLEGLALSVINGDLSVERLAGASGASSVRRRQSCPDSRGHTADLFACAE